MSEFPFGMVFRRAVKFRDFHYESSEVLELLLALLVLKYACDISRDKTFKVEAEGAADEAPIVPDFFVEDMNNFFSLLKEFSESIETAYFSSEGGLSEVLEGFVLKAGKRESVLSVLRDVFEDLMRGELPTGRIGDFFEFELKNLYEARGLIGSEFYTPRGVVDFLVSALAPAPGESIFDPVCGSAGFLVSSDKYARSNDKNGGGVKLRGVERNRSVARLAKWNLFVHGCTQSSIFIEDSLANCSEIKFDAVFANPPFSVKTWDWDAFERSGHAIYGSPPRANADYAYLQYIISSLNDCGRAAVIVPSGVLFRAGAEKEIRSKIVMDGLIDAVVALPSGMFKNTSVSLCVLFIDKRKCNKEILFVRQHEGVNSTLDELQYLLEIYRGRKEISGVSRVVGFEEIEASDYDLNFVRYIKSGKVGHRKFSEVFAEYSLREERLRVLQDEIKNIVEVEL